MHRLERMNTLPYVLDMVGRSEKQAFMTCYKSRGTTNEVVEWWGDICERIVPKFPEPEPTPDYAAKMLSESKAKPPQNKLGIWWLMTGWYLDRFQNDYGDELWKYKNKSRATEIRKKVANEDYDTLLFCNMNLAENNIEPSPGLRLGIISCLYYGNEQFACAQTMDSELDALEGVLKEHGKTDISLIRIGDNLVVMPFDEMNKDAKRSFRISDSGVVELGEKESLVDNDDVVESYIRTKDVRVDGSVHTQISRIPVKTLKDRISFRRCLLQLDTVCDYLGVTLSQSAKSDAEKFKAMIEKEYRKFNPL